MGAGGGLLISQVTDVDFVAPPKIWGFALDGAEDSMLERFVELTQMGYVAWVLMPVPGARIDKLEVPRGFRLRDVP